MRKLGRIGVASLALIALGAMPAAASAQGMVIPGPVISLNNPTDVAYDPFDEVVYVSSVGPPPRVYRYDEFTGEPLGYVDLPADADPGAIEFDENANLVVVDRAQNRTFTIDAETGQILGSGIYPASLDFPTGFAVAFQLGQVISDFGSAPAGGGLFYGFGFGTEFPFGPTIHPNGVDLLPGTGKTKKGRLAAELLVIDAEHSQVHSATFSGDAITGSQVVGVLPGTPGLQPPRDIDVSPVALSQRENGKAIHPVMVPIPDLGNVFVSIGPAGPWAALAPSSFGRPVRVDSDCASADAIAGSQVIGVTDFTNDKVSTFVEDLPKEAECNPPLDLIGGELRGDVLELPIAAEVDAKGRVIMDLPGLKLLGPSNRAAPLAAASARKKVRFTAGKVKKVRIELSGEERDKLSRKGKLKGKLKIKIETPSGRRATIEQKIRLRR